MGGSRLEGGFIGMAVYGHQLEMGDLQHACVFHMNM